MLMYGLGVYMLWQLGPYTLIRNVAGCVLWMVSETDEQRVQRLVRKELGDVQKLKQSEK